MILVIAERHDHAALWLARRLSARAAGRVAMVTPLQLVCSTSIAHRLSTAGSSSAFVLADGTRLDLDAVSGVVNRMAAMPMAHLASASAADRDYAASEWHAFLLGWLASLACPVLNPPAPEWLAGALHSSLAATQLALAAGLAVEADHAGTMAEPDPSAERVAETTHFACCGQLVGPILEPAAREAILSFAHAYGAPLLQVETAAGGGRRQFLRATSFPDFTRGGSALVNAIERALAA